MVIISAIPHLQPQNIHKQAERYRCICQKKTWDLITSIHQIVPKDEDVAGIITNKGKSAIFYPSNMRDLAVKDWNLSCK